MTDVKMTREEQEKILDDVYRRGIKAIKEETFDPNEMQYVLATLMLAERLVDGEASEMASNLLRGLGIITPVPKHLGDNFIRQAVSSYMTEKGLK